jgi:hypothetical protein
MTKWNLAQHECSEAATNAMSFLASEDGHPCTGAALVPATPEVPPTPAPHTPYAFHETLDSLEGYWIEIIPVEGIDPMIAGYCIVGHDKTLGRYGFVYDGSLLSEDTPQWLVTASIGESGDKYFADPLSTFPITLETRDNLVVLSVED